MRYIDADKLQKDGWKLRREKHGLLTSTYETMELDCVPTVDAVEVVRCKDCLHGSYCEDVLWCSITDEPMCEDDYCSKGDRL